MPRCSRLAFWLALLTLMIPALAPASTNTSKNKAGKKASGQPAEPARSPLPQELPPVPPTVTFQGGQLSILAPNSTLLDILTAVRKATGAAVDAPAGAAGDRVATRLGPGRPREVLAALLAGSRFDYILLGSAHDPGAVRRLILSPRSGAGAPAGVGTGSAPNTMFSRPTRPPLSTDTSDEEDSQPEQAVEPAEEVAPEPQDAPPPEVKTPEQIQEELRQQQELQRQHQEQEQQQQQPEPPQ